MENKCKNCNSKISKKDLFCPNCGESLKDKKLNPDSIDIEEDYNSEPLIVKQNKKSTKGIVATILVIVLIACLSFSIAYNVEKNREYTITFDSNGGSVCSSISTNKEEATLPIPTRTDCYFDGWYTSDGILAEKAMSNNVKDKKDLKFHAKWYTYETINLNIPDYSQRGGGKPGISLWHINREIQEGFIDGYYNVIVSLYVSSSFTDLASGISLYYIKDFSISFNLESYGNISLSSNGVWGTNKKISNLTSYSKAFDLWCGSITNITGTFKSLTEVE